MEETGRVKHCLDECSMKVTHPDGKCSEILVSNPGSHHLCSPKFERLIQI